MHLYRQQYASPEFEETVTLEQEREPVSIKPVRPTYLREEIGYWRKANHIHKWFVDNVQKGEDDCREYIVERNQLGDLLHTVKDVLEHSKLIIGEMTVGRTLKGKEWEDIREKGYAIENPKTAEALLPIQSGCFFGGTDYAQWYVEDLWLTQSILEVALSDPAGREFIYTSSW